jgi:hypothetical protein
MSTALLSQGLTITWAGSTLSDITRITINGANSESNGPEISVAHLGSCHCKEEPYMKTWAASSDSGGGNQIQIDFMGVSPFTQDQIGNFVVTAPSPTGQIINVSNATCLSVQQSAQVGDVVRGSATIKYA